MPLVNNAAAQARCILLLLAGAYKFPEIVDGCIVAIIAVEIRLILILF
jgi:hypothetical protein